MEKGKMNLAIVSSLKCSLENFFKKDISIVAIGSYLNAFIAFLCSLIVSRYLGPTELGVFAVFLTFFPIIFELTGHGLDSALVRFATPEVSNNKDRAAVLFKLVLIQKIFLNIIFIVFGLTLSKPIILWITGSTEYLQVIRYAFFMGFGFSLWRYALSIFQSLQTYPRYVATLLSSSLLRLSFIILAYLFFTLDITQIMLIYIGSTFSGFILGMIIVPESYSVIGVRLQNAMPLLKKVNRFSIWLILSTLLFIIIEPLNLFMIKYFYDHYAVGVFAAALILAKSLDYLNLSIKTVLLPKASLLNQKEYRKYINKCLKITAPLAIAVLPLFFMSKFIIEFVLTEKFVESTPIFNVLFWGYWISLLLDPIWLIFYSAQKTRCLVYADSLMLFIVFGCNIFLIPRFGAIGAAYSFVIARLLGRCLLGVLLFYLTRKRTSTNLTIQEANI